jgi:hypothetical protein
MGQLGRMGLLEVVSPELGFLRVALSCLDQMMY